MCLYRRYMYLYPTYRSMYTTCSIQKAKSEERRGRVKMKEIDLPFPRRPDNSAVFLSTDLEKAKFETYPRFVIAISLHRVSFVPSGFKHP